ncbi:MAG: S-methyl-5-thioribose-1-phosphate isomerase [Desulfovibrio sp.]|nr:S-methyl-5-thioribose-1-phosphate isomerase [Desulfovibrio sp.]
MESHIVWQNDRLRLLDQRFLPEKTAWIECVSHKDAAWAIKSMIVRGAPLIGVTAAFGCVLAADDYKDDPVWRRKIDAALTFLSKARPTAVNLSWAIEQMRPDIASVASASLLRDVWLEKALAIQKKDEEICRTLGKAGERLVPGKATILTHCNAGALATAGYGTALGVIRAAHEAGKDIRVIADETRPFNQGSRLTAWELSQDGIPVKIACDNSAAALMKKGLVDLVITGADRIAANGDTANKIGTLGLAILADYYDIPFYIAAPLSTIDRSLSSGDEIPIEERSPDEVLFLNDKRIAPDEVSAFNFAFDVAPASLIDGIITEKGILRPPYDASIANIFKDSLDA